jgi:hypothetical protein
MLIVNGTTIATRPGGRSVVLQQSIATHSHAVRIIDNDTVEVAGMIMKPTSMENGLDVILNDSGYRRILTILEEGREIKSNYALRKDDESILTTYETAASNLINSYVREMLRTQGPIERNRVVCVYINQARALSI